MPHLNGATMSTTMYFACKGTNNILSRKPTLHKGLANPTLDRYNNLELATYQNDTMSGKSDLHVDISKSPRGDFFFPTWKRKNSSEESNETSEEMNDAHVENKKYPRGDLRFSTWIFEEGGKRMNFPVKICK